MNLKHLLNAFMERFTCLFCTIHHGPAITIASKNYSQEEREGSEMRVKTLSIENFRGINEMSLEFGDSGIAVFVGVNGSGKTSILECLAILLSRLTGRIRSTKGTGRFFTEHDITIGTNSARAEIQIVHSGKEIAWRVTKARRGRKDQRITNLTEIKALVEQVHEELELDPETSLPVAVYYSVNRAVLDIPLRIRTRHPFDQLAAYDLALAGGRNDFRVFFEWFRNREDIENEERLRRGRAKHRDRQLEAVRKAVYRMLDGFSHLSVRRSPLRMTVRKNGKELTVNQLSDGEKCLMALIGDLARRLAIANPHLENPLNGEGVVLIDEIDLHLHPKWQRDVIIGLREAFPSCQFFLSSHSPQVLSEVKREEIYLLLATADGITASHPSSSSYGRETNQILEETLGVAPRPPRYEKKLRQYFRLLAEEKFQKAERLREELEREIGEDEPKFARADALLRRREILSR